jgi:hypothetical protein
MKISREKRRFLKQELKEYEKIIPMTEEERTALHEWVAAGNSVHENGSMASYEGGRPMDFLDVYREEEEIQRALPWAMRKGANIFLRNTVLTMTGQ